MVKTTDRLEAIGFSFILFENLFKPRQRCLVENLFKPRQLYLQPQTSVLSNLRLAA
ncbi:hypothetical protein [Streptococcus pneumoniae]|uniref:hypothetical protein n=1 Tax=Streptococcus pneumoniae TaxID=1313 RepID=UPI0006DCE985|nr:hypothetical protein [Streptococcus pneumoniae]